VIQGVTAAALSAVMGVGAEFQQALPYGQQPALPAGQVGQTMPSTQPAEKSART
jgi:hypothetical protein